MTFEEAEKVPFNPFDVTKVWPQGDFPLIPVGKFILDRNPQNYFTEVEQIAFSPAHFVPGIDASPDKMLQGRLFSYSDTHRHRLGPNYLQLPVNCPFRVRSYQRDGFMCYENQGKLTTIMSLSNIKNLVFFTGGAPNYHPNSFGGPLDEPRAKVLSPPFQVSGESLRYDSRDEDNFSQPRVFWQRTLDEGGRTRLVNNIVNHMAPAAQFIQERAVKNFMQVDPEFGRRVAEGLRAKSKANL